MLRFIAYLTLTLTWLAAGIALLLGGAVTASLTLLPYLWPVRPSIGYDEVRAVIGEQILLGRLPASTLDALLLLTPAVLILVGALAVFVALQVLQLTLKRDRPGQAILGVGFGVFFVLLLLFADALLTAEIMPRIGQARSVLCAAGLPAGVVIPEAQTGPGCLIPPGDAAHPFYRLIDYGSVEAIRRGMLLLGIWVSALTLPLLLESGRPPRPLRRRYERQYGAQMCPRCGVIFPEGQTPACPLCRHTVDLEAISPADRSAVYGKNDLIPIGIRVGPLDAPVPVRNPVLTLVADPVLAYADHQSAARWKLVGSPPDRRQTRVTLAGPDFVLDPQEVIVNLRVLDGVERQRPRVAAYAVTVLVQSDFQTAASTLPLQVTVQRAPTRRERLLAWIVRRVQAGAGGLRRALASILAQAGRLLAGAYRAVRARLGRSGDR